MKPFSEGTDQIKEKSRRISDEIRAFKSIVNKKFTLKERKRILHALHFMMHLHGTQEDRDDGKPYIIHPLEVADDLIRKYHVHDPDLIVAALLHDSLEDQAHKIVEEGIGEISEGEKTVDVAFKVLYYWYGTRVAHIVMHLSNPDFTEMQKLAAEQGIIKTRHECYADHVAEIVKDPDVGTVKFSDFCRNALEISKVPDVKQRAKLKDKYGRVLQHVFIPKLEKLDIAHPLFSVRDIMHNKLLQVLVEEYGGWSESMG